MNHLPKVEPLCTRSVPVRCFHWLGDKISENHLHCGGRRSIPRYSFIKIKTSSRSIGVCLSRFSPGNDFMVPVDLWAIRDHEGNRVIKRVYFSDRDYAASLISYDRVIARWSHQVRSSLQRPADKARIECRFPIPFWRYLMEHYGLEIEISRQIADVFVHYECAWNFVSKSWYLTHSVAIRLIGRTMFSHRSI